MPYCLCQIKTLWSLIMVKFCSKQILFLKNFVCKMFVLLFRPQWVNTFRPTQNGYFADNIKWLNENQLGCLCFHFQPPEFVLLMVPIGPIEKEKTDILNKIFLYSIKLILKHFLQNGDHFVMASVTHSLNPGRCGKIFQVYFSNSLKVITWALRMKLA